LIGVYDLLPQIEWTTLFLGAQGYAVRESVLYQDNKSAMLLERNGKASSSRRTKHLHIRYFYIKNKVDSGEIRLTHCPTEDMLGDFFTKPLQGQLFRRLRDRIMNIDPCSVYHSTARRSVLDNTDRRSTDRSEMNLDDGKSDAYNGPDSTDGEGKNMSKNVLESGRSTDVTKGDDTGRDDDEKNVGSGEAWQGDVTEGNVTKSTVNDEEWIIVKKKKGRGRMGKSQE
jgi:hypothetical protein